MAEMSKFHANAKAICGAVLSIIQDYGFSVEYLERNLKFVADRAISNVRKEVFDPHFIIQLGLRSACVHMGISTCVK